MSPRDLIKNRTAQIVLGICAIVIICILLVPDVTIAPPGDRYCIIGVSSTQVSDRGDMAVCMIRSDRDGTLTTILVEGASVDEDVTSLVGSYLYWLGREGNATEVKDNMVIKKH
jgi:hypothetical protein